MLKQGIFACLAFILICSSCTRKRSVELGRPAIYDAWEARYSYQMEDRKMVPIYKGREVGRTWGRDSQGRLDEAKYLGTSLENDEDLFALHQKKLDKQRNRQWENAKEARAERVREMFADIEAEEDDSLIEIVLEDEEEEFIPAPSFIPVGIDMGSDSVGGATPGLDSITPAPMGLPFAPLPQ